MSMPEFKSLDSIECPMCGQRFIPLPGSIYKLQFASKTYKFCSYTCYHRAQKVKENTNEAEYKRILKSLN